MERKQRRGNIKAKKTKIKKSSRYGARTRFSHRLRAARADSATKKFACGGPRKNTLVAKFDPSQNLLPAEESQPNKQKQARESMLDCWKEDVRWRAVRTDYD